MMKKIVRYNVLMIMILQCVANVHAADMSIFAEELLWNASEQTAGIWSNKIPLTSIFNPHEFAFAPQNINFNWSQGFRGGVTWTSDTPAWETTFKWTYFPTQATVTYSTGGAQIMIPEFFSGFISSNYFFGANLDWQLNMNMFDLIIAHPFDIMPSLALRPLLGVKAGTIDQVIHSKWDGGTYTATENIDHNYRGIGPELGIDARWDMGYHLHLIADFSSAWLWGNWNIQDTYKRPSALLVTPTTITTRMNQTKLGTLMLDYLFGLEWVHQGRSQVRLKLGYEMQFWANQVRLPTFQLLPVRGDLTIQGATCGIFVDL